MTNFSRSSSVTTSARSSANTSLVLPLWVYAKGCPIRLDLLQQYSNQVAKLWESEFGRRPQVYVSSYVALNHHEPQLLVDPQADLAAVDLRWFGRNEWSLMLDESRAANERHFNTVDDRVAFDAPDQVLGAQRGDMREGQLVKNVTRGCPQGKEMEERECITKAAHERGTLTTWYRDGTIKMRAPMVC